MDNTAAFVFSVVLILGIGAPCIFVYSFNTRTEYFQVLNKHPMISECAIQVLAKNEYVGCRLHKETGICEKLHHSSMANLTIDERYSYAIEVRAREDYNPNVRE
ncbi:uncharacterized protein LOC132737822 [Ruditapes philippinarum]|uniref:uncharacterized protein LOC132737822 n=1 Tax=Ruditapes philippinarum TaxID=129788 RepID=UPI00295BC5C1|nr:uncharacterized protein LOC132737822 [Ruditapes philippinarum]